MSSLLTFLMLAILFAAVATLYTEGMWSNAVRLINVVSAALLATNFFEPLARWMDDMMSSYTYYWDFLALWILFVVFTLVLRVATDQVSMVKLRFLKVADQIGTWVFAFWIGWVMVCFTMMTLHRAVFPQFPLRRLPARTTDVPGVCADRQWLGFVQKESRAFLSMATPDEWEKEKYVFDPHADFMPNYATRRTTVESACLRPPLPAWETRD